MPGPDPNTVWFEEYEGRLLATYEPYLWSGNVGNRKARAIAILKRLVWHDWFCRPYSTFAAGRCTVFGTHSGCAPRRLPRLKRLAFPAQLERARARHAAPCPNRGEDAVASTAENRPDSERRKARHV